MMVSNINCLIPTHSKVNKTQPYVVMRGLAKEVFIKDETATIK
jgi:hypothetical protein|tara:strand:- start:9960 stop:10088 length:129 start_codon:yes stop_codon:yes gene_type:complete